jgi:pimeloyl-ACP methyl ester carboxylesterase
MQQTITFSISSGAAVLAAERTGVGRPLICLHAGVADRRMYAGQFAELSDRFEIIAYDRRGYGDTRTRDEPFRHVDDLATVIDEIGVEKPILLGCSQGGRIAIDYTLANPQNVGALILISAAISGAPDEPVPDAVKSLADALDEAEEAEDFDRMNVLEAHIWLDGPTSAESRVEGPLRELFLDMNRIALMHPELTQMRQPPDAFNRLDELHVPTLLIHGTLDFDYIGARHEHLAGIWPHAQSVACEGRAHLLSMEDPAFVNDRIRSFCLETGLV